MLQEEHQNIRKNKSDSDITFSWLMKGEIK